MQKFLIARLDRSTNQIKNKRKKSLRKIMSSFLGS